VTLVSLGHVVRHIFEVLFENRNFERTDSVPVLIFKLDFLICFSRNPFWFIFQSVAFGLARKTPNDIFVNFFRPKNIEHMNWRYNSKQCRIGLGWDPLKLYLNVRHLFTKRYLFERSCAESFFKNKCCVILLEHRPFRYSFPLSGSELDSQKPRICGIEDATIGRHQSCLGIYHSECWLSFA